MEVSDNTCVSGKCTCISLLMSMTTKSKKHAKGIKKTQTSKKSRNYQSGRELAIKPKTELKCFDVPNTTQTFAAVAAVGLFNPVVNGAELYQRTGRKIYMKSLHLRGIIQPNASGASVPGGEARMLIVYDSQPNAALPAIAALLQDSNAAAATSIQSEINLTNRARFQILRDKQFLLGATTAAAGQYGIIPDPIKESYNINEFIKLHGLETVYNGVNGGTIADITSGSLLIFLFADGVITGHWDFVYGGRLRYYD